MESHLTDIARVIQLAVAPVFLLTAIATLITALNNRLGRIDSFGQVLGGRVAFQRIARRDQPPHLVEAQRLQRDQAELPMAFVRRIEGAAEETDPHAWHPQWQAERRVGR